MRLGAAALAALLLGAAPARAADKAAVGAAVDRGVKYLKTLQLENGTWSAHDQIGMTALAGLALLECGVPADDAALRKAADAVRAAAVDATQTYSLALSILFLDRLGQPVDLALIESLAVRLLAGQCGDGSWTYNCPMIAASEQLRLASLVKQRPEGGRDKESDRPEAGPRTVRDLPREIQVQLELVQRQRAAGIVSDAHGDHSNTQFAIMGLWVARRHGLTVDAALRTTEQHFRQAQFPDGGWGYTATGGGGDVLPGFASTAAMTCAGLLAVGSSYGAWNETTDGNDPRGKGAAKPGLKPKDVSKDRAVLAAYRLLGVWLDAMAAGQKEGAPPRIGGGSGKFYYFLWSLERAAVAFGVERFGKTDWYDWGADILLANQGPDGGWVNGAYGSGPDTCFALLFLRRANLAKDLSRALTSQMKDGMQAALRQGGIGGAELIKARQPFFNGPAGEGPRDAHGSAADAEAARLARRLASAAGDQQDQVLRELRDTRGAVYTQALAAAIPNLQGEALKKAREALAERLARMTTETLGVKLEDDDAEVRRAAALAVAVKEDRAHTYKLIELLGDPEAAVGRAAHAALKSLSGQDFGPARDANRQERARAILDWKAWWSKQPQGKK
jgi:hypothetical protein